MSAIIKSAEMKYKNPNTGDYTGINVVAEKKTREFLDAIEAKGETVMSDIPASYDDLNNIIAESYDATKTYNPRDYCRYTTGGHDKLYQCIADTSEDIEWTPGHWRECILANEVSDLKSAFEMVPATVNLLDNENGFVSGYYIGPNGTPVELSVYSYYDYIKVDFGVVFITYQSSGITGRCACYDDSYTFLGHAKAEEIDSTYIKFTLVKGTKYIRGSVKNENKSVFMIVPPFFWPEQFIEHGKTYLKYDTLSTKMDKVVSNVDYTNIQFNGEDYVFGACSPYPTSVVDKTEQQQSDILFDQILYKGVPQSQYGAGYFVTNYIAVEPNTTYFENLERVGSALGGSYRGAFYTDEKVYISNCTGILAFTTPSNCYYIRLTVKADRLSYSRFITEYALVKTTAFDAETLLHNSFAPNHAKYYVKYDGTDLYFSRKFDYASDIVFKYSAGGANGLVDLKGVYFVANYSLPPTSDFSNLGTNYIGDTDWISPYRVVAVNNADGDWPNSNYLTGGVHGIQDTGNVATASQTEFTVYVDGMRKYQYEGYCNSISMIRYANIQGANTEKADGTGRSIINERVEWDIDITGKINVFVSVIAMEDVKFRTCYGLQASLNSPNFTNGSTIRFIGSKTNRTGNAWGSESDSGDKNCRVIKSVGKKFTITTSLDNVDIGDFAFDLSRTYSAKFAWYSTYGKHYFMPIISDAGVEMDSGDYFYYSGSWMFKKTY